jgi:hypothetical protein
MHEAEARIAGDARVAPIDADACRIETVISATLVEKRYEMLCHAPGAASDIQYPVVGSCAGNPPHILEVTAPECSELLAAHEI